MKHRPRRRHLIKIEQDDANDSDSGNDWQTHLDNVPARVWDKAAYERLVGQQIEATVKVVAEIRYYSGITEMTKNMRMIHGSRTYNIGAVMDMDGRQRELVIYGTEAST